MWSEQGALNKAFSRPVTVRGEELPEMDVVDGLLHALTHLWRSPLFTKTAQLLEVGIETPAQYRQFKGHMVKLSQELKGALGTYRRKNNYDVMVATEHLRFSALDDYPVEKICGTSLSLRCLYGVQGTKTSD